MSLGESGVRLFARKVLSCPSSPLPICRMGFTRYLTERSILDIWAARPGPATPLYERTATSRALAEKHNTCYKTVQKIWNKKRWANITDRAPVATETESQLATTNPDTNTGRTVEKTANALAEAAAGVGPDGALSPAPTAILSHDASSSLPGHNDLRVFSSNRPTYDSLLRSNVGAGMIPASALPSSFSSHSSHPLSSPLGQQVSTFLSSNIATQDSLPHHHTDWQASAVTPHYSRQEALSSLAESDWMPDYSRSMPAGWRQRRVDPACFHCKTRKLKCDGKQPCGACCRMGLASECADDRGETADSTTTHAAAQSAHSSAAHQDIVDPEPPISQGLMLAYSPKPDAGDPMRPNLGGMGIFVDFGWKARDVEKVVRSCPPKLRAALDRLSCVRHRLMRAGLATRKLLPEVDAALFQSENVCRSRYEIAPDGSKVFLCNDKTLANFGVHKEEFAARMGRCDMPVWHTEYRVLCWVLESLLQVCFNTSGHYDIFQPFRLNTFDASGKLAERWHVHRWRHSLYANGIASSGVHITAEEFDRGIAQRGDAMGVFAECTFSGCELLHTQSLVQRELMSRMAADPEGRRRLDALADKVVHFFRLRPALAHCAVPAGALPV